MKSLFRGKCLKRLIKQVPEIIPLRRDMTQTEREKLRDWLESSDTRLALRFIEGRRPTVFPQDNTPADRRLYQLQGWEMFRNELQSLVTEPEQSAFIQEEFQSPDFQ